MKKAFIYILLVTSIGLNSCSKGSSGNGGGSQSLPNQIIINGQTYSYTANAIDISGTGSSGHTSCNGISSFYQFGPIFENASYYVDLYLVHYQNDKDFMYTAIGNYPIKNDSLIVFTAPSPCYSNMDLLIDFQDKTVNSSSDNSLMQNSGATNKVTSITLVSSDSGSKTYRVSGTFSCTVINPNNKSIPVSGNYNIYVKALL